MNSTLTFTDVVLFNLAVNVLALDAIEYEVDAEALTIYTNDAYAMALILESEGISKFDVEANSGEGENDERMYPGEDMDGDFDSAMASAGYGTDEDYGYNGGDE